MEFRIRFQNNCPYNIESSSNEVINNSYNVLTAYFDETNQMEEEAKTLNNLETLFDL
jgi:hypothetical protein